MESHPSLGRGSELQTLELCPQQAGSSKGRRLSSRELLLLYPQHSLLFV